MNYIYALRWGQRRRAPRLSNAVPHEVKPLSPEVYMAAPGPADSDRGSSVGSTCKFHSMLRVHFFLILVGKNWITFPGDGCLRRQPATRNHSHYPACAPHP